MRVQNENAEVEEHDNQNSRLLKNQTPHLEDGDETHFYFEKLLNFQTSLSSIVLINLLLVVTSTQFNNNPSLQLVMEGCLWGCVICAVLQLAITVMRIKALRQLRKAQKVHNGEQGIRNLGYWWLLECLIFLIQPNPWSKDITFEMESSYLNITFDFGLNDFLSLLSLVKIYSLVRLFLLKTLYMNPRSYRLCRLHGCESTYQFALKSLFKDRPATLIMFFFVLSIVVFSYALQICERPISASLQNTHLHLELLSNAIWLTIVTMTTVGFGDYYPTTPFGRVIILFVVVWGIFIVSIMVVVVTNTLKMDKAERKTFLIMTRLELTCRLKEASENFIKAVLIKKFRKQTLSVEDERRIQKLKDKFHAMNEELKNMNDNDDTYEQMSHQFSQVNDDIKILNKNQEEIINYIHHNFEYGDY